MQDCFHQQYDGTTDGQGQSNQPLRKIPEVVVDITHMLHGNGIFDLNFMVNVGIDIPCMKRLGYTISRGFFFPCLPLTLKSGNLAQLLDLPFSSLPTKILMNYLPFTHGKCYPWPSKPLNFQKMEHDKVVVANIVYFHPLLGEMIRFDYLFFKPGWFNHQQDDDFQFWKLLTKE